MPTAVSIFCTRRRVPRRLGGADQPHGARPVGMPFPIGLASFPLQLTNHTRSGATPSSADGGCSGHDDRALEVRDLSLDGIDALAIANTVREPLLVLDE